MRLFEIIQEAWTQPKLKYLNDVWWDDERYLDIFSRPEYKTDTKKERILIRFSSAENQNYRDVLSTLKATSKRNVTMTFDDYINGYFYQENDTLNKIPKPIPISGVLASNAKKLQKQDQKKAEYFLKIKQLYDQDKDKVFDSVKSLLDDQFVINKDNYDKGVIEYTKKRTDEKPKKIRIASFLEKQKQTDLLQKFANDPVRDPSNKSVDKNDYLCIISRNPGDIELMTKDRKWEGSSCMNLNKNEGAKYVPMDIQHGTLIAYCTSLTDINIKKPVGRILIKPYINKDYPDMVHLGVERRVYGKEIANFKETVVNWVDGVNSLFDVKELVIGKLHDKVYKDGIRDTSYIIPDNMSEEDQMKLVNKDGYMIKHIKNPSEQVQLVAVKRNEYAIEYIKNPSEQVQIAAVKQNGYLVQYIKNPSERVQMAAVKEDRYAIKFIKNPSEQLQMIAVKQDGYVVQYIKNPSEQLQMIAVKQDGLAIEYINNPSEKVQIEAVKQNGYAIYYIKNPSEQVQMTAVKQYGLAIRFIDNPSEQLQIAAVKQYGWAIEYIKNPTDKVKQLAGKL